MAEENYKWRIVVSASTSPESYILQGLPKSESISPDYVHKPGDIDYSEVKKLRTRTKQQILYYLATGIVKDDKPENWVAMAIASMIFQDRLTDPNFVPDALNPDSWIW